jgi:hypothetical protein
MNHRVANLDACRETVENQAPGFGLEDLQKLTTGVQVFLGAMYRSGELTLQVLGSLEALAVGLANYDQRGGSKDFVHQDWIGEERPRVGY